MTHPIPPVTTANGRSQGIRHEPGLELTELRAAHEEHHVDADHPSSQPIGRLELTNQVAKDHAHRVRGAGRGQTREGEPEHPRQAERCRCGTVDHHAREQHVTAPFDEVDATHHQRARDNGADCRRGVQPAVAAGADVEDVLREDRQQGRRRRKERREEVQEHRRADERRAKHEAQALERGGDREIAAHTRRIAGLRVSRGHAHHQQRRNHYQERCRVDGVDPRNTAGGDHQAAEGRAGDRCHLHHDRVEGDRVRQMLGRHQIRHERLPRRQVEGTGGGTARRQNVNRPHRRQAVKRQRREDERERRHHRLRDDHQAPSVERVSGNAAQERKADDRNDANQADHPEGERAVIRRAPAAIRATGSLPSA